MNVGNVYCVLTAFYDLFNDGNSFLRNYGKGDYRKCVCIKTEDWNSNIGWLIPADKGMIDEASTVYDIQVYINDISYILHLDYIFVCDKHFTIKDPNEQTSAIPQLNEKDIERVKRKYERYPIRYKVYLTLIMTN